MVCNTNFDHHFRYLDLLMLRFAEGCPSVLLAERGLESPNHSGCGQLCFVTFTLNWNNTMRGAADSRPPTIDRLDRAKAIWHDYRITLHL